MITNEQMLALTAKMPCKQINIPANSTDEGALFCDRAFNYFKGYIQRYYAGTFSDNKDLWLHRFLTADSERHLHSHGFNFVSVMISGRYEEEFIDRSTKKIGWRITTPEEQALTFEALERACMRFGHGIKAVHPISNNFLACCAQQNTIDVFDWHRITSVEPGTWTALVVDADRLAVWSFQDDNGKLEHRDSSPRDWWKSYLPRGQNVGDVQ